SFRNHSGAFSIFFFIGLQAQGNDLPHVDMALATEGAHGEVGSAGHMRTLVTQDLRRLHLVSPMNAVRWGSTYDPQSIGRDENNARGLLVTLPQPPNSLVG